MNEIERIEREAENDGYRDEFQRAYAVSRMNRKPSNLDAEVRALVAEGYVVAVAYHPVYCKVTDALLGEEGRIIAQARSREELVSLVASCPGLDPDDRVVVLPPEEPEVRAFVAGVDDDVPF